MVSHIAKERCNISLNNNMLMDKVAVTLLQPNWVQVNQTLYNSVNVQFYYITFLKQLKKDWWLMMKEYNSKL